MRFRNGKRKTQYRRVFRGLPILVLCFSLIWAASGDLLWQVVFDHAGGLDEGRVATALGNRVYVAGDVNVGLGANMSEPDQDFVVRAYDGITGALLWQDQFDLVGERDAANSIAAVGNRVYAAGQVRNPLGNRHPFFAIDLLVRAYEADTGAVLWQDQFDLAGNEDTVFHNAVAAMVNPQGQTRVYVGGRSKNDPNVNDPSVFDILVRAYDGESGVLLWQDLYDHAGHADQVSSVTASSNRIYVSGTVTNSAGNRDAVVRAYDAETGTLDWQTVFDLLLGRSEGSNLHVAHEGRIFSVGGIRGIEDGQQDLLVFALDENDGTVLWTNILFGGWNLGRSIAAQGDRVFVSGFAANTIGQSDDWDFLVRAYDATSGTLVWQDVFDLAGGSDRAETVRVDGDFVVAAGSGTNAAGNQDLLVRAYFGETGYFRWQHVFDLAGNDDTALEESLALISDRAYVTGYGTNAAGNRDLVVLAFDGQAPPVARCQDIAVSADASCAAAVMPDQIDDGSFDPEGDPIELSLSPTDPFGLGSHEVTLTATDPQGAPSTCSATVTVVDDTAPVPDVPNLPDVTGECEATVDTVPTATDNCAGQILGMTTDPLFYPEQGVHEVTWKFEDGAGNTSTQAQTVIVQDLTPPVIACPAGVTLPAGDSCQALMPDLLDETEAADNCGLPGLTQSPLAGSLVGIGETEVMITAADGNGNSSTCTTLVTVSDTTQPIVSNTAAVPNPVAVNTPVVITADIADPCSAITSAEFSLDGGLSFQPMDPIPDPAPSVSVSVTVPGIAETGIRSVCVRGTDQSGGTAEAECIYLPVFDPNDGFVSGGGWIWSPPGAFTANPIAEGKAQFGFVSKYQAGASTPTGNTRFRFKVSDLGVDFEFKSDSYDWLVVAGAKAIFKGTGTMNGSGSFRFMLTARDGDFPQNNAEPDRFRIRIWEEVNGQEDILYDNQLGDDFDADPTTTLGGGSIIIHTN